MYFDNKKYITLFYVWTMISIFVYTTSDYSQQANSLVWVTYLWKKHLEVSGTRIRFHTYPAIALAGSSSSVKCGYNRFHGTSSVRKQNLFSRYLFFVQNGVFNCIRNKNKLENSLGKVSAYKGCILTKLSWNYFKLTNDGDLLKTIVKFAAKKNKKKSEIFHLKKRKITIFFTQKCVCTLRVKC